MQITLPAIAFGGSASAKAIPAADDPWGRWLRAVALGGQGFYAAAATELRRVDDGAGAVLRSLSASTRAAHLRQGGRHHRAAEHDGRALHLTEMSRAARCSGPDRGSERDVERMIAAARCDALTGLAADDLGRGMFGAADRLLDRVGQILDRRGPAVEAGDDLEGWIWQQRPVLRWRWVRAELAMYTSDPVAAVEHAAAARVLAEAAPSVRHRIKSDLIGAAAAAAAGDHQRARAEAAAVAAAAESARQLPLEWAAAKLLEGTGAGPDWAGRARRLSAVLAERGGAMG